MQVAHDQAMLLDSKQIKRRWTCSPPFRTSARQLIVHTKALNLISEDGVATR